VMVLIVEDDDAMRALIKTVVGDLADSFCECNDGLHALELYAMHRPDWVLMDLQMPQVDGLCATSHITTAWPAARVLIVSAFADEDLQDAAMRAGATGFVSKDNLLETRRWLAK
jgi:CheY-like chemotaxis protein